MTQPAPRAGLSACADAADTWLFDRAIPLWLEHGVDRERGGFYEALDLETLENRADFKRLRVVTRQIYVFAEGARRGVPRSREAVDHGLAFLLGHMRHPEGGFASRCDLDGRIIDPTRDLYDHAFTLFALAHAYRLTADSALKAEASALLDFIRQAMRHPAGGYVEGLPATPPRRQNPHMHLLEAALACAEHMPDPTFDRLCEELAGLCARHFLDAEAGLLFEYYSDDLVPERVAGLARVEPGHHFEWAWLLTEVERITGRTVAGGAALARFAVRHGLDPATGLLRGELFDDGSTATASVRLWPHGEWLKAALALGGDAGDPLAAWDALRRFLDAPIPGLWLEQWDAERGLFLSPPAPASSLYHITTAVMELRRHADAKSRVGGRQRAGSAGAVFFDRDGVLNEDVGYLHRIEDFRWVEGAREALRLVQEAGLLAIIVTNQSGVARGFYTEADVAALHAWMRDDLARDGIGVTAFYSCPYHAEAIDPRYRTANHPDRKPNPGMILRAIEEWNIDPARAVIVGDKERDLLAGRNAGIPGRLFTGGNLAAFIAPWLPA